MPSGAAAIAEQHQSMPELNRSLYFCFVQQQVIVDIERIGANRLAALRALACTTFMEAFAADNSPEQMQRYLTQRMSEAQLLSELQCSESEYYFALYQGEPIAYLKLNYGAAQTEDQGAACLELERIYVLQKFWERGVGQQLLDFAFARAASLGKNCLWLGVWEYNYRALRFYQKNGFEVFGKHSFVLGTELQEDLLMRHSVLPI